MSIMTIIFGTPEERFGKSFVKLCKKHKIRAGIAAIIGDEIRVGGNEDIARAINRGFKATGGPDLRPEKKTKSGIVLAK